MKPLDLVGRGDAFTGDPDTEGVTFYTPLCCSCKHKVDVWTCKAYPSGIPAKISTGEANHNFPFLGDHMVVYEKL